MSDVTDKNYAEADTDLAIETKSEVISEEVPLPKTRSTFIDFLNAIREETIAPIVQKLQVKWAKEREILDASWTEKYGDRYLRLKDSLDTAKLRYREEKGKLNDGQPTVIESKQSEWETSFAGAGVFAARAEERIKQRLIELWENRQIKR
jgi:hypothetical protein